MHAASFASSPVSSFKTSKISPQVRAILGSKAKTPVKIWVYFKDHGETNAQELVSGISEAGISPRSLKRRINRSRGPVTDIHDILPSGRYIERLRETGSILKKISKYFNAVSAIATPEQIKAISKLEFVKKIDKVHSFRRRKQPDNPIMEGASKLGGTFDSGAASMQGYTGAPGIASTFYGGSFKQLDLINVIPLHDSGVHGQGILVGMLDTGFNRHHVSLNHLDIIAEYDFVNNDSITENQSGDPSSQHNHGTYTLSALGGYAPGTLIGPAWEASFALGKTEQVDREIQVEEDDWVRGIEWMDSLGADVVSSSLGYLDWYQYSDMDGNTAVTTIAADIAAAKGITVVTAVGNEGPLPWPGIIAPSDGDSVIAVGAVDSNGVIAYFSSEGPSYDGRFKPEVCGQGVAVLCASPFDSLSFNRVSGTSLSTPLVGGACALLLQMHPYWTPIDVRDALTSSASRSSSPDNFYGWGVINTYISTLNGSTGVEAVPWKLALPQNDPNPFSPSISGITNIRFNLDGRPVSPGREIDINAYKNVSLDIFSVTGARIKSLFTGILTPGPHSIPWDGTNDRGERLASGVYFFRLNSDGVSLNRKIVLINP